MTESVSNFPSLPFAADEEENWWVDALKKFNCDNKNAFVFGSEDMAERRDFTDKLLGIAEFLAKKESPPNAIEECLSALAVMSRDRLSMSGRFTTKRTWDALSSFAGLKQRTTNSCYTGMKAMIYACKCLSNIIFLTKDTKGFCDDNELIKSVVSRLRDLDPTSSSENDLEIEFLTLRLLFLISVFSINARTKIIEDFEGRRTLIDFLNEKLRLCNCAEPKMPCVRASILPDHARSCSEALKTIFYFNIKAHNEENQVREEKIVKEFEDLTTVCRKCLLTQVKGNPPSTLKLHTDAENALYSISSSCFNKNYLIPTSAEQSAGDVFSYEKPDMPLSIEGRDVSSILTILRSVENKVKHEKLTTENLQPVLALLSHLCRNSKCIRKYCKRYIIPPRKDFDNLPEIGPEFRNKLIKLFTNANTEVKAAAADFIFVLCKEKVDRLVKYTGYGNAAGLLASRGLLAGGRGDTLYSDTDSDSDTEEYKANVENINPVTGHIPPEMPNPMEGMSDEQKEYLAMQLANQLSKLSNDDTIKPVCVDPSTGNLVPFQQRVHKTVLPEEKDSDDSDND